MRRLLTSACSPGKCTSPSRALAPAYTPSVGSPLDDFCFFAEPACSVMTSSSDDMSKVPNFTEPLSCSFCLECGDLSQ